MGCQATARNCMRQARWGPSVHTGTIGTAAGYVAVSLLAGFAGLFAGLFLMRALA